MWHIKRVLSLSSPFVLSLALQFQNRLRSYCVGPGTHTQERAEGAKRGRKQVCKLVVMFWQPSTLSAWRLGSRFGLEPTTFRHITSLSIQRQPHNKHCHPQYVSNIPSLPYLHDANTKVLLSSRHPTIIQRP